MSFLHFLLPQKCLIVLGMHRSGTSCLTGTIEQCGVTLGEVFTQNPYNKKGNRESADVQALNNDVLAENGGAWNEPVVVTKWSEELAARRDEIIAATKDEAGRWWGFKDPRVVLTLPFWLEAISAPRFIGTFRHPHLVALSLQHRDRSSLTEGYRLWLAYNRRLLELQDEHGFDLVDFDLTDDEYREDLRCKLKKLGLVNKSTELFFDPSLRHHQEFDRISIDLPADVSSVYRTLRDRRVFL